MDIKNQFVSDENAKNSVQSSSLDGISVFLPETYSQDGEDLIVASLLRAQMQREKREMSDVIYVEIGANHPISTSNTYLLYKKYGARGVLVEADPRLISDLQKVRPRDAIVQCAISDSDREEVVFYVGQTSELSSMNAAHIHSFGDFSGYGGISHEIRVPNIHVNRLMKEVGNIDFLSIDCEGLDYDIIKSIDFESYKPYIIQCEPSEHFSEGNTRKIINYMESRSYKLQAQTGINLVFTRVAI
ncbi:FkbM family methyltransferase [Asaia siamensis]|uniref:Methyltransferase FkbM domain-containing protein n=1 Tax=Asaia siamensis TaxID=110479 RepID=A0ABQ1MKL3_9PROT|nr:FkbM family methyltransferase [Asaia siamensis]GBR07092.1 SAM-dependent methyltransferase [Asaia siamensis NRIC 0323]GGC42101.1 hypothetical protein GCM10007207_29250 [Asaia siamensis]